MNSLIQKEVMIWQQGAAKSEASKPASHQEEFGQRAGEQPGSERAAGGRGLWREAGWGAQQGLGEGGGPRAGQ